MKRLAAALAASVALCSGAQPGDFAIAVHGGAGDFTRAQLPADVEAQRRAVIVEALEAGRRILAAGGASVDAVVAAVQVLEDSPQFNAGKGSVLTSAGTVEMDASVMEGRQRRAGAVAGVTTVKNPVAAARAVMEKSPHVMLAGSGADRFAREQGLAIESPGYFVTPERQRQLQRAREREAAPAGGDKTGAATPGKSAAADRRKYGTVGAVALDKSGNLAAATSTGGIENKRPGRVGDVPVIGAGIWAENESVAVSLTGTGETILRSAAAHDIAALVKYRGYTPQKAADEVMEKVKALDGRSGAIVLDRSGAPVFSFNTAGMYRGYVRGEAPPAVLVFR